MPTDPIEQLTYEQKEARLAEILDRLDNSRTPMDELAAEAKEAGRLIVSMQQTLKSARQEIVGVFEELERQKAAIVGSSEKPTPNEGGDVPI